MWRKWSPKSRAIWREPYAKDDSAVGKGGARGGNRISHPGNKMIYIQCIMHDVLELFENIHQLKRWFVDFSGLNKYEAYKIWARWIITHMSLHRQTNVFLPSVNTDSDLQIVIELMAKGCAQKHAQYHCAALAVRAREIANTFEKKSFIDPIGTSVYNLQIHAIHKGSDVIIGPTSSFFLGSSRFRHSIPVSLWNRLYHMYDHSQVARFQQQFAIRSIWMMLTMYHLLDGKSLQWSVPKGVFECIQREFGCNTELFASPLNAYFKRYYSLFNIDQHFGAKGNFFTTPAAKFTEGCYQINPPFIDVLFSEISSRILDFLETADRNGKELTFIYVMPDWDKLGGFEILKTSKYCVKIKKIYAGEHFYKQAPRDRYIRVHFNTNILILSTNADVCSDYKMSQISYHFKHPVS